MICVRGIGMILMSSISNLGSTLYYQIHEFTISVRDNETMLMSSLANVGLALYYQIYVNPRIFICLSHYFPLFPIISHYFTLQGNPCVVSR